MKNQTVTMDTSNGDASATKEDRDRPWEIAYPWGADRFFGSIVEVRSHMKKARKKNDPEWRS